MMSRDNSQKPDNSKPRYNFYISQKQFNKLEDWRQELIEMSKKNISDDWISLEYLEQYKTKLTDLCLYQLLAILVHTKKSTICSEESEKISPLTFNILWSISIVLKEVTLRSEITSECTDRSLKPIELAKNNQAVFFNGILGRGNKSQIKPMETNTKEEFTRYSKQYHDLALPIWYNAFYAAIHQNLDTQALFLVIPNAGAGWFSFRLKEMEKGDSFFDFANHDTAEPLITQLNIEIINELANQPEFQRKAPTIIYLNLSREYSDSNPWYIKENKNITVWIGKIPPLNDDQSLFSTSCFATANKFKTYMSDQLKEALKDMITIFFVAGDPLSLPGNEGIEGKRASHEANFFCSSNVGAIISDLGLNKLKKIQKCLIESSGSMICLPKNCINWSSVFYNFKLIVTQENVEITPDYVGKLSSDIDALVSESQILDEPNL